MKYRKKPVVIEAHVWAPNFECLDAMRTWGVPCNVPDIGAESGDGSLVIRTLEGDHKAMPGDFIIRGVKGEFYLCKPDIFEATYEKVLEA